MVTPASSGPPTGRPPALPPLGFHRWLTDRLAAESVLRDALRQVYTQPSRRSLEELGLAVRDAWPAGDCMVLATATRSADANLRAAAEFVNNSATGKRWDPRAAVRRILNDPTLRHHVGQRFAELAEEMLAEHRGRLNAELVARYGLRVRELPSASPTGRRLELKPADGSKEPSVLGPIPSNDGTDPRTGFAPDELVTLPLWGKMWYVPVGSLTRVGDPVVTRYDHQRVHVVYALYCSPRGCWSPYLLLSRMVSPQAGGHWRAGGPAVADLDVDGAKRWDEKLGFTGGAGIPDEFGGVRGNGAADPDPKPTSAVTRPQPPGSEEPHVTDAAPPVVGGDQSEWDLCPIRITSPAAGKYQLEYREPTGWRPVAHLSGDQRASVLPIMAAYPKPIRLKKMKGVPQRYSTCISAVLKQLESEGLAWILVRPGNSGKGPKGGGLYQIASRPPG